MPALLQMLLPMLGGMGGQALLRSLLPRLLASRALPGAAAGMMGGKAGMLGADLLGFTGGDLATRAALGQLTEPETRGDVPRITNEEELDRLMAALQQEDQNA